MLSEKIQESFSVPCNTHASQFHRKGEIEGFNFGDWMVTDQQARSAIRELKVPSSPGPDLISFFMVQALALTFCYLMRRTLDHSEFPKTLKMAHVLPLLKKTPCPKSTNQFSSRQIQLRFWRKL